MTHIYAFYSVNKYKLIRHHHMLSRTSWRVININQIKSTSAKFGTHNAAYTCTSGVVLHVRCVNKPYISASLFYFKESSRENRPYFQKNSIKRFYMAIQRPQYLIIGIVIINSQQPVRQSTRRRFVCTTLLTGWLPNFPEKCNFATSNILSSETIKSRKY